MALREGIPEIVEMAAQRMAVVHTIGDPNVAAAAALKALYGAVYTLKYALKKQGLEFKVGALRARWPDAHEKPKSEWTGIWALPIPEDTLEVVQKDVNHPVIIETWTYGAVAQILHAGTYAGEGPSIATLHAFIAEQGYEISGMHEEEYLTRPQAKNPKVIIRYPVTRR